MASFTVRREHAHSVVTWLNLTTADSTGDTFSPPTNYKLESIQFFGTLGVGGAVELQAANDDTAPFETVASGLGLFTPTAPGLFYQPAAIGGDGTTNLTAVAYFRRL